MSVGSTSSRIFLGHVAGGSKSKNDLFWYRRPAKCMISFMVNKGRGIFLVVKKPCKSNRECLRIDKESDLNVLYSVSEEGYLAFTIGDRSERSFQLRFGTREERDEFIALYQAARLLSLDDISESNNMQGQEAGDSQSQVDDFFSQSYSQADESQLNDSQTESSQQEVVKSFPDVIAQRKEAKKMRKRKSPAFTLLPVPTTLLPNTPSQQAIVPNNKSLSSSTKPASSTSVITSQGNFTSPSVSTTPLPNALYQQTIAPQTTQPQVTTKATASAATQEVMTDTQCSSQTSSQPLSVQTCTTTPILQQSQTQFVPALQHQYSSSRSDALSLLALVAETSEAIPHSTTPTNINATTHGPLPQTERATASSSSSFLVSFMQSLVTEDIPLTASAPQIREQIYELLRDPTFPDYVRQVEKVYKEFVNNV